MKKTTIVIITIIFLAFSQTSNKADWFNEANKLYEEKMYDSASVLYLQILENYGKNSAIFYNIANCAYRNGDVGAAILYLERAKLLLPDDKDVAANLDYLRTQTIDKFEKPELSFMQQSFNRFQNLIPLQTQIIIIVALSFLITIFLGFTLFSAKYRTVKIYTVMILFFILSILGVSTGIKYDKQKNTIRCVVLNEAVSAYNEPQGNKVIFSVHEGTVLNVIKTEGNWYFVSLQNGVSGWIQKQSIEII
jgi:tetratricopeptide (TPR) repeat protein